MKIAIFQFSLFGINTYVVYDPTTREAAIIDPGMSSAEEQEALAAFIEREHLHVCHVINTHLHIDHAIGNSWAVKKYDTTAMAHPLDLPLGQRMNQQAQMFGMPPVADNAEITEYINDGDLIKIGNGTLQAIHVPGHSPGSIVLYDREDGFMIAGDVLFNGSIGRTDLPGGDHHALIDGIHRRLLTLPDDTKVYPGHGPATTIGAERRSNPFLA